LLLAIFAVACLEAIRVTAPVPDAAVFKGGFPMSRGLLLVFTGNGKGKTTAALGMVLRASGHGMTALILQFIKGSWTYGELEACKRLRGVTIRPLGSGFTWKKDSMEEDRRLAVDGWKVAAEAIGRGEHDIIVLDEVNIVLSYGLLPVPVVLDAIRNRPRHVHVVATGRNAPEELIAAADAVTEMRLVKHHYQDQKVPAQKGIEF
jgi:cob(I)alamin adenosyltransferase